MNIINHFRDLLEMKNTPDSFIRKAGKVIDIDLSYFLTHGFWITLRYGVVGGFGILLLGVFAHFSSKEFLGQYQYLLSVLALFSIFSLPGMNMAALEEVSRGNPGAVRRAIRISFIWSWLAVPCILLYGIFTEMRGQSDLGMALIAAGILFPFFYAPNTWYVFYEGVSKFRPVTIRIILSTVVTNLFVIVGIFLSMDLFWIIIFFLGFGALFNIWYYREISFEKDERTLSLDVRYGISCTAQKFTYSMTDVLPPLVIAVLLGFEAVATYQVAYLSTTFISGFMVALSVMYVPLLFKHKRIRYARIVGLAIAIGFLLFLLYTFFLQLFFVPLFGKDYIMSYDLAQLFSFSVILLPLRTFLINFFTTRHKNRLIVITNFVANGVALILFYGLKDSGFFLSLGIYFYATNLIFTGVLLFSYRMYAKKNSQLSYAVRKS